MTGPEPASAIVPRVEIGGVKLRDFPKEYLEAIAEESTEHLEELVGVYERWIDARPNDPVLCGLLEDAMEAMYRELASREPVPDGVAI